MNACKECGYPLNGDETTCPECGAPVVLEEIQENENFGDMGITHESFNEAEPYSPYNGKFGRWLFRDPWFIRRHPIGALNKKHPFIGWLFGPWHLTSNPKDKESYDTLNNIFYFFNLLFKIWAFAGIWTICKAWWMILISIIVWPIIILIGIIYIVAVGKALHRYGIQLHKVFRRITKRFWLYLQNN